MNKTEVVLFGVKSKQNAKGLAWDKNTALRVWVSVFDIYY